MGLSFMKLHPFRVAAGLFVSLAFNAAGTAHYVDIASVTPMPPYTNWTTAAVTIQAAVDAAGPGDEIVVTNGIYATGGRVVGTNLLVNRVAVGKPLAIRSVNGPQSTIIQGYQVPGITNGDGAIRCVYLTDGASLSGFTLTNGGTLGGTHYLSIEAYGGGVWCESLASLVSNCLVVGNSARAGAGGALNGTLNNCTLAGNVAQTIAGGGAIGSALNSCLLIGNSVPNSDGGAAYSAGLTNCALIGNSAKYGGGPYNCVLYNCTVCSNSTGAYYCTLYNCIVYFNENLQYEGSSFISCCTTPLPPESSAGGGIPSIDNFTNEPLFIDLAGGNLRLQSNSPCINSGKNAYAPAGPDLDGNPRIQGGTVDIGAYEFQFPTSAISYAWLQQYGFPSDGSADSQDTDSDGMNNLQEWIAGTNPTNASSVLMMLPPSKSVSGITVSWESVSGISYFLQRSTNIGVQPTFRAVKSNLVGQVGITAFADTNAAGPGPFFYRVGVQ